MNNLFQLGSFTLASGYLSRFKIECDALTDEDWTCLAWMLFQKLEPFGSVSGVPTSGFKLAEKMQKYCTPGVSTVLIVDDVYTTGGSIERHSKSIVDNWLTQRVLNQTEPTTLGPLIGAVVFSRVIPDKWITPLFVMNL